MADPYIPTQGKFFFFIHHSTITDQDGRGVYSKKLRYMSLTYLTILQFFLIKDRFMFLSAKVKGAIN